MNDSNAKKSSFTNRPFFQIIQNLTSLKNPNLKSNVFDKMLSEEMLNIKQNIYDKDKVHVSSVQIASQNRVATPTLEVKQKWPIMEFISKLNEINAFESNNFNKSLLEITDSATSQLETNVQNEEIENDKRFIKAKILGLRSLDDHRNSLGKLCSCMKSNPSTTCTHSCSSSTKSGLGAQKYTAKCNKKEQCTRSHLCENTVTTTCSSYTQTTTCNPALAVNYSLYPLYYPYQAYYITRSTEAPYNNKFYYPVNYQDDFIISKKRKKYRKPAYDDDYLYYENYKHDKDKHGEKYSEKPRIVDKGTETLVIDIDYEDNSKSESKGKLSNKVVHFGSGLTYYGKSNELVNEIVEDLKAYYGDVVIRDCYCSMSSKDKNVHTFLLVFFMFVTM